MADRQTSAYGTSVSPILMFGTGFLALTLNVGADADVIYKNVQYVYPDDSGMSSHLYGNGLSLPDDGYLIEPKGVLSVPDKLLDVKSFFSLNVSDMSNVFDVSRPMIYSWLNGDSSPRTRIPSCSCPSPSSRREQIIPRDSWPRSLTFFRTVPSGRVAPSGANAMRCPWATFGAPQTT